MNCPACKNDLTEKILGDVTFDVCQNGCGGIWFDLMELRKVDEKHETLGEPLLNIEKDPHVHVDHDQRRNCPVCRDVVMMRHFASVKREIELDECPRCGGFWLDAGELGQLRDQFDTDQARSDAAKKLFDSTTEQAFAATHKESKESADRAKNFAKMFRFICPSNYIPGKQKWGAF